MVRSTSGHIDIRRLYGRSTLVLIVRGLAVVFLFALHIVLGNMLGTVEYGLYNFALAVAGVLASLASLGLPTALMRFIGEYQERARLSDLKGALLCFPTLALVFSMTVAAILWFVAPWFDDASVTGIRYAALLLPLFVLEQIRRNVYQGFANPLGSVMPDELLRPVLLATFIWFTNVRSGSAALHGYMAITATLAFVFLAILFFKKRKTLFERPATYRTHEWLATAIPMVFGGIGYLLISRADVIMLGAIIDMNEVGIYSAANRIAMLSQIILGTTTIVTVPMITKAFHGGRLLELKRLLKYIRVWIVALILPIYAGIMLAPAWLLHAFGTEYVAGTNVLRILACGQMINAAAGPVGLVLSMIGQQKKLAVIMVTGAIGNIVLNALLIPEWGAIGAAVASAICFALLNATLLVSVYHALAGPDRSALEFDYVKNH